MDEQRKFTITEAERKRLLHAYETLMFEFERLSPNERVVRKVAWFEVTNILLQPNDSLKTILHGGGDWAGDDLRDSGHWEVIK